MCTQIDGMNEVFMETFSFQYHYDIEVVYERRWIGQEMGTTRSSPTITKCCIHLPFSRNKSLVGSCELVSDAAVWHSEDRCQSCHMHKHPHTRVRAHTHTHAHTHVHTHTHTHTNTPQTPLPRHPKVTCTCGEEAAYLPKKNEHSVHNLQSYLNGFKAKAVPLASQFFTSHHPQEGKQL